MKYTFILLALVSSSAFGQTVYIKNFKVLQTLKLNKISKVLKKKSLFLVKPGVYQITYKKDDGFRWDSLNVKFLDLNKTAKFQISKPLFMAIKFENSFIIPAKGSLQAYTIGTKFGNPKVVNTWSKKQREACILRKIEAALEICESGTEYIPFAFRDNVTVRRGGRLFCYKKPVTEVIWGQKDVYYKFTKTQADATIHLVNSEQNNIVAQGDFIDIQTKSIRTKEGKCY